MLTLTVIVTTYFHQREMIVTLKTVIWLWILKDLQILMIIHIYLKLKLIHRIPVLVKGLRRLHIQIQTLTEVGKGLGMVYGM